MSLKQMDRSISGCEWAWTHFEEKSHSSTRLSLEFLFISSTSIPMLQSMASKSFFTCSDFSPVLQFSLLSYFLYIFTCFYLEFIMFKTLITFSCKSLCTSPSELSQSQNLQFISVRLICMNTTAGHYNESPGF